MAKNGGVGISVKLDGAAELAAVMRGADRDLKRDFRRTAKLQVTNPLARLIEGRGHGNYLIDKAADTVKPRSGTFPTVVVGGAKRVGTGGITAGQAAVGGVFGANREKVATVRRGGSSFRRHTARQMPSRVGGKGRWFFPTFEEQAPRVLAKWEQLWKSFADKWGRV